MLTLHHFRATVHVFCANHPKQIESVLLLKPFFLLPQSFSWPFDNIRNWTNKNTNDCIFNICLKAKSLNVNFAICDAINDYSKCNAVHRLRHEISESDGNLPRIIGWKLSSGLNFVNYCFFHTWFYLYIYTYRSKT